MSVRTIGLPRQLNFFHRGRIFSLAILWLLLATASAYATAGFPVRYVGTMSTVTSSSLTTPKGVAVDLSGNVYIADTGAARIVKVAPDGTTTPLSISGATLNRPMGLAVDSAGNLYIADAGVAPAGSTSQVVKVASDGTATAVSTGAYTLSGAQGIALNAAGDIYVADTNNNRIIKIASGGSASLLATSSGTSLTGLSYPMGLATDLFGNLYITDSENGRIVKVTTTLVGSTISTSGVLASPTAVCVGMNGTIYVANGSSSVRIAVVSTSGDAYDLFFDQRNSDFGVPSALAVSPTGTLYVADTQNNAVKAFQVDAAGFPNVTLGSSGTPQTLSFIISGASTLTDVSIYTSGTQNLDFTIAANSGTPCTIEVSGLSCTVNVQFTPLTAGLRRGALVLSYSDTIFGSGSLQVPLFGRGDSPVAALSPGVASVVNVGSVAVNQPFQTARDGVGNIYVTSYQNSTVLKIPAGGGSGTTVTIPALPSPTTLNSPTGLAMDGAGNLFIADYNNSRLVRVTPAGTSKVVQIRGLSTNLSFPTTLNFTPNGRLLIDDYGNGRIILISPDIYDNGTNNGDGSVGYATAYVLPLGTYTLGSDNSTGIVGDAAGNVYFTDQNTNPGRVIKLDPLGKLSVVTLPSITLNAPLGVGVDPSQNLFVVDSGNQRVIQQTTSGATSVLKYSGPSLGSFVFGIDVDGAGNILISDFSNNRLVMDNVGLSSQVFPSTKQFTSSTSKTSTVTNLGNLPLVFSANPTYTANFSQDTTDVNPCTSSTSLSAGTNCDVAIVFSPQSVGSLSANISVTNDHLNVVGTTQIIAVSGTATNPGDVTSTAKTSPSSTSYSYGQPISIAVKVSDVTNSATIPTGSVVFTDALTSAITQRTLDSGGNATLLSSGLLSGIGTHSILASYGGVTGSFQTSSTTLTIAITKDTVSVTGPSSVAITPGQSGTATITVAPTLPGGSLASGAVLPSGSISYSILSGSSTVVGPTTAALTAGSGNATASLAIPNTLSPGSYTISASYAGDTNYQAASAITIPLTISKVTPTITLTSSQNPSILTSAVTFTATLSSTAGTPSGTVSFYDATTLLGTVTLSGAQAAYTTSSLATATHSITAVYSGDSKFVTVTSAAVAQLVQDFVITTPGSGGTTTPPSQTVTPGGTATYSLNIGPSAGTVFPAPVTLSLSGLPPGATGTLSPTSLPAGSSLSSVTLTIVLPHATASTTQHDSLRQKLPLALGLLLIPFARRWRRISRKLTASLSVLLILMVGFGGMMSLTGCGTQNGFFTQAPATYTVTITATSGNLSHSTYVTLTVQ